LSSTGTTYSYGGGTAAADALTARVDEALVRLSARLDEAVVELQMEVPRLKQENHSQRMGIENISNQQETFATRAEELEKDLAAETQSRRDLEKALGALERRLSEEVEARHELEKALGLDLRELVGMELERMRESVMREMRERMDGQKVLREEVQLQQASLMRLTTRIDDSMVEVRTELPRLSQETASLKGELGKLFESHRTLEARVEGVERNVLEETEARQDGEERLLRDTSEYVRHETGRLDDRLLEFRQLAEEQRARMEGTYMDLKAAHECVEQLAREAGGTREAVDLMSVQLRAAQERSEQQAHDSYERLCSQLRAVQSQTNHVVASLERKMLDLDADLRSWVDSKTADFSSDAAAVGRINSVDSALRKEMSAQTLTNQHLLNQITHNSERWCQLQSKFDELLVEVQNNVGNGVSIASLSSSSSHLHPPR